MEAVAVTNKVHQILEAFVYDGPSDSYYELVKRLKLLHHYDEDGTTAHSVVICRNISRHPAFVVWRYGDPQPLFLEEEYSERIQVGWRSSFHKLTV